LKARKHGPIRVGDKFKSQSGTIWEVIRTIPGGKLDLFDRDKTRFAMYYHRQVREMERVK
jgi:hypothetical protein